MVSFRGFVWLLAGLGPAYLVLAAVLPPADDELYYWCWSQRLQLSYYDHPPMTAYLIRAATAVFGDTLFAIRLPAVVSTLTVLFVIGRLTRPRQLLPLVVLTPLFTLGAVLVTPDTPLLMFWALYVLWLVTVHQHLTPPAGSDPSVPSPEKDRADVPEGWSGAPVSGHVPVWLWPIGGVILGCGILGKYTTGLAVIAGFLSFVLGGNWRRWVVGYAAHLAVAFVVTLPILIHNLRYDFIPLKYQWEHSMGSPEPGLLAFLSFVGIQILLFGFFPFGVFVWAIRNRRELLADPRLRVCTCLFVFPFAFFLYKATRGPLEGNWALACYIAVWPLAAVWYERFRKSARWRWVTAATFAIPAGCVLLLVIHLIRPIPALSPHQDRITRQAAKEDLAEELASTLHGLGATDPVFAENYQWTAMFRFHQIDARQINGITRASHFTQHPEGLDGRDHAYVFAEGFLPAEYTVGFGPGKILKRFSLVVRGEEVGVYWLLEYTRSGGPGGHVTVTGEPARLDLPRSIHAP